MCAGGTLKVPLLNSELAALTFNFDMTFPKEDDAEEEDKEDAPAQDPNDLPINGRVLDNSKCLVDGEPDADCCTGPDEEPACADGYVLTESDETCNDDGQSGVFCTVDVPLIACLRQLLVDLGMRWRGN